MPHLDWEKWILGLWAAFVGGGAGSVTAGLTSMGIDPEHYNLSVTGIHHLLLLGGTMFIVNGVVSAIFYLKQSPVPQSTDSGVVEAKK